MKTSAETGALAEALAKAQGEIQNAEKSSTNPFFKSNYADLAEVLGQIRPVFSANSLAITQSTSTPKKREGVWVTVCTRVMHSSGEWIEDEQSLPVSENAKNVAQEAGSIITYLRRYQAAAFAGIAQEDVDANSSHQDGPVKRVTAADLKTLRALIKETDSDEEGFCAHLGIKKLDDLPLSRMAQATRALNDKKATMEEKA